MKEVYYLHVFGRHYPIVKRYFEDLETLYDFLTRLPRVSKYRPIGTLEEEKERSCVVLTIKADQLPNYENMFIARS